MRIHAFGLCVASLMLFLVMIPDSSHRLALGRNEVLAGEWWRIVSGQLSHLGPMHALMNTAGFLMISVGFRRDIPPIREALALGSSMLAVATGLLLWNPEIRWYLGMSGAIYGVLTHHLVTAFRDNVKLSSVFLMGVAGKICYEQWFAPPDRYTEHLIGGIVAVDAHLYGATWGLCLGLIMLCARSAPAASSRA